MYLEGAVSTASRSAPVFFITFLGNSELQVDALRKDTQGICRWLNACSN